MSTENKFDIQRYAMKDDCKKLSTDFALISSCLAEKDAAVKKLKADLANTKLDNDHLQLLKQEYFNEITALKSKIEYANDEIHTLKNKLLVFEGMTFSENQEIAALKSKLEIAKKGLEFYAECGEIWSSPTVDADGDFDGAVFKFSGENGLKETARQALKEINEG